MSEKRYTGEEIIDMIEQWKIKIPLGSTWSHYKNKSNHYKIIDLAFDSDTQDIIAIYKALYIEQDMLFTRKARAFSETILHNAQHIARFTLLHT